MEIKPKFVQAGGAELVVLTREEFEALMDLAGDPSDDSEEVALYDARKAAHERGDNPALPDRVSRDVLAGDSLLKAVRKWRGKSQIELAEASGIGQGYLSDLENRRRVGSPETLAALARALDVPVVWIMPQV